MRYKSFRVKNFKGIKDTTVQLQSAAGASVFAFVGLNESGKTTILEAIHSFAPDEATSELLGGDEGLGVPFKRRVPRHLLSEFTGEVSVAATLFLTEEDKKAISNKLQQLHQIEINTSHFPSEITLERTQQFQDGDFKSNQFSVKTNLDIKTGKQKVWRHHYKIGTEHVSVRDVIFSLVPRIAYFPTSVFEFPKTIFLTERGSVVDKFYRRVFQDILDYEGRGQTVEKDIVGRVRRKEMVLPWISFFTSWGVNDDKDKIQQVMDRASAVVTKLVFGRWNEIFGEDTRAC